MKSLARMLVALALLTSAGSFGQYPSRPVRVIVHAPPGSAPDIISRVLGQPLSEALGQQIVVENRTGSNGNIAGELVARSTPDGHTLLLCVESILTINPHVYTRMPFDPLKDLVPIATVASNEFVLTVHPSLPVKDFREFIAFARKAKPPLTYGSGGNGSQHHLTMEMLKQRAKIDMVHVPYKGGGPATAAVIGGEVAAAFAGASAAPQVKAGKLRALATAGKNRLAYLPDVPTIGEFYPGFANSIWFALCAPRGTPDPVLARLRGEVNKALALPDTREKFARGGALTPWVTTPEEMADWIRSEYDKYGKIVKEVGVHVD
ncbi:MAG TPA: tripartite tricarboxylate transporter substrate binding protein [Burkholderiales bacterium]|nr:tripartite tricarboxylate transporter substrate binding protein [Burkholderiales bacterium]